MKEQTNTMVKFWNKIYSTKFRTISFQIKEKYYNN